MINENEKVIVVKNLTKKFYIFNKTYKIIPWLITHKGYKKVYLALDNISFDVKKGEVVGIIGKNGAGKSTLMKLIAGITYPNSGTIEVNGEVGSLINLGAGFEQDFTGRKNIYYKGMLMGKNENGIKDVIDDIIEFAGIGDYIDLPLRTYSSGMSTRLGYSLAVHLNPDILLLDEIFAVGDKSFREKSKKKTIELFNSGKSVIFASHSDDQIKDFCSRVIYLKDHKIVYDGDVQTGLDMYNDDIKNNK